MHTLFKGSFEVLRRRRRPHPYFRQHRLRPISVLRKLGVRPRGSVVTLSLANHETPLQSQTLPDVKHTFLFLSETAPRTLWCALEDLIAFHRMIMVTYVSSRLVGREQHRFR